MCEQIEFTRASHHQHVLGGCRRRFNATVTRIGALLCAKCAYAGAQHAQIALRVTCVDAALF